MASTKVLKKLHAALEGLLKEQATLSAEIKDLQALIATMSTRKTGAKRGPGRPRKIALTVSDLGPRDRLKGEKFKKATTTKKAAGKRKWSSEQKAAAAERMRAYWINRRNTKNE